MNATALKSYKHKDLAKMAKQRGISGWHSMRKDQLIEALAKSGNANKAGAKQLISEESSGEPKSTSAATKPKLAEPKPKRKPSTSHRKIQAAHRQREERHDLSTEKPSGESELKQEDRIVLMVRDPYWLHAFWDLGDRSIERAQAALAENWHSARPILRLIGVPRNSVQSTAEVVLREIEIHGAVCNWYIDVTDPPSSFRVDIGYLTSAGQFYSLARSNVVTTPRAGGSEMMDGNWAEVAKNSERIYAMSGGFDATASSGDLQDLFEQRLRRPMGSPMATRFGNGAESLLGKGQAMKFQVDAEVIVYGMADPDAFVTMRGEPIKLAPDGSFTARISMPDRRQIIPIVAGRSDGVEEQTIVLAIERNTKVMEPVTREPGF